MNNSPKEAVMNNPDLRGIIFSYFRGKDYMVCMKCKKVCRWRIGLDDRKYVHWNRYVNCHNCFYKGFLGHTKLFNPNIKRKG